MGVSFSCKIQVKLPSYQTTKTTPDIATIDLLGERGEVVIFRESKNNGFSGKNAIKFECFIVANQILS